MTMTHTRAGAVRGREVVGGIQEFRGIPYAEPPIGERRFQPPLAREPWEGVRDAVDFGATAPQPAHGALEGLLPNRVHPGDDYLTLNVWTPDLWGSAPVMVFIHGGAFSTGSGSVSIYDGARFARDGVVLVTINYRLGVDGFLWTGEGVPNLGLLDQVAALEWVRDNIAAFGGDPGNITIFGESAGAMSVCTLMVMPRAKGLFHRAIAESGAGVSAISPESAKKVAARVGEVLGVEATREAIGAVPIERVLAAATQVSAEVSAKPRKRLWGDVARNLMLFEPVVDGEVLPGIPEDLLTAGVGNGVDLLIGTNSDEARLFFVPSGAIDRMPRVVASLFGWTYGARRPGTVRRYRRNRPGAGSGEIAAAIMTDGFYRMPALRLAEGHAGSFVYEFAWRSGAYDGRLGACHALELGFVFDALDDPAGAAMLGGPAPQELADAMHSAWVRFAATGDPGWPAYTPATRIAMRFDTVSGIVADDRADERALWRRP
ncbi:carboxylesterase/lipase family protein [Microbacterium rhizomatis]|uniref:Carboxylic ester hydrolase n=1 Tax=Microbacterium rhizomatis TaxID=1631477 RepID=A0A5J5J7U4_9MICO|nr:carboxylesterase/lipase family protein [Microbacterium rhizomatis]KAA9111549.1 carboxylesterase/lipase family protein [Microbacterium rhizomatis]